MIVTVTYFVVAVNNKQINSLYDSFIITQRVVIHVPYAN